MRKIFITIAIAIAVCATVGAQRMSKGLQKLLNAEYAISRLYVDTVNEDKLVEDAIVGMLEKLDPHSSYTNAKETKELTEPLQGEFSGIGIQFNISKDTLMVVQTTPNGPSERVGLLPGDRIVTVNDTLIAGVKISNADVRKKLRGKKGTKVLLGVKRGTASELMTFKITRDNIPLHSVDASYMMDDGKTGYIRISSFGQKTHKEMMDALDGLTRQGMTQVIIDLTDNGGGYLNAAIDMVNEFLDKGQMIVYTQGNMAPRNEAKANGSGKYRNLRMVVMVNQYSASAAEIFSGAMQDWDRAVVVGRRSFGKGLVQRPFEFEDGSMMRLTVSRYYTPSGRCIQKPYQKGDKHGYEEDILNRSKAGEYYNIDSIPLNDSLRYTTLKNKRVIYGGGGIVPDIFVPIDTTRNTRYYRELVAKGVIYQFALNYVDSLRSQLTGTYASVAQFKQQFQLNEQDLQNVVAAGEKEKVKFNEEQFNTSKSLITIYLKGLICRDIFTETGAYSQIVNSDNADLDAAYQVINDERRFNDLLQHGNPEYEKIIAAKKKQ